MPSDRPLSRNLGVGAGALALVMSSLRPATADTGDVAVAEALFRDGKDLLGQKDYARACPKLAESFRRDPATGTLLALAICHERDGKLASAWAEYADAASRSKTEARGDREKAARAKVLELEAAVSRLTVSLADDAASLAGLEVKTNGSRVAIALLGTALPVDGGKYLIEASAPGKKKWSTEIAIEPSGDKRTVRVPLLEDAKAEPAAVAAAPVKAPPPPPVATPSETHDSSDAPKAPEEPEPPAPHRGLTTFQQAGIATGVAGVAGLGFGTYFAFRAVSKNNDSKSGCVGDLCAPAAKQSRLDARTEGNFATVGFVGGGALAAAGLAMLVFGRGTNTATTGSATPPGLHAFPIVSIGGVGGALGGSF